MHQAAKAQCSDLSGQHKDALTEAVDKVVAQPVADIPEATVLKPQLLVNVSNYLTQQDWDQLDDINKSWLAKTNVVVGRLKKLGIKSCMNRQANIPWPHCSAL